MQKFIMISGSCGSGKTDSMLKIAAANSHLSTHNIYWNGEMTVSAIVERCEAVKANLSSITIISPDTVFDGDLDSIVSKSIGEAGEYGFNLYIDDPFRVKCNSDDQIQVDPNSPLNQLIIKANEVYTAINTSVELVNKNNVSFC